MKKPDRETELYAPVAKYLEGEGYAVHAEVKDCDVTATRDGTLIVVELKRSFTLKLLYQAVERLTYADGVYVAIPASYKQSRDYKYIKALLKRLGVGLMLVDTYIAEPVLQPVMQKRDNKHKRAVEREADGRSLNLNVAGVNGRHMTAYKERALRIAALLREYNVLTARELTKLGMPGSGKILRDNYQGWFVSHVKGQYMLSPEGAKALMHYSELLK